MSWLGEAGYNAVLPPLLGKGLRLPFAGPLFVRQPFAGLALVRLLLAIAVFGSLGACQHTTNIKPAESAPVTQHDRLLFSPELLRADMDVAFKQLQRVHPALYSRTESLAFEQQWRRVRNSLTWPMQRREFFLRLAPLIASLNDWHTRLIDASSPSLASLPLALLNEPNGLFVAADLRDSAEVPLGAQLLSINGRAVESLLPRLYRFLPNETASGQRRMLQLQWPQLWQLLYPDESSLTVEYLWQDKIRFTQLELTRQEHGSTPSDSSPVSFYGYSNISQRVGLLWLNDFYERPEVFEHYLEELFQRLRADRTDHLVIDLRYNRGGLSSNMQTLLAYLSNYPVKWGEESQIRLSSPFLAHHASQLHQAKQQQHWSISWLPTEWLDQSLRKISWSEKQERLSHRLDPIQPKELSWRPAQIYVLTSGFCYSACAQFAAVVNHYRLAETIGERVGSRVREQFAYPVPVTLPNTGLTLTIPAMQVSFDETSNEQGLSEPVIHIERSPEDIQNRVDTTLNFLLRRILQSDFQSAEQ